MATDGFAKTTASIESASSVGAEDDIVRLISDHRQLGLLCSVLEYCAEASPTRPPEAVVEQICGALTELYAEGESDPPPYPNVVQLYDTEDPLAAAMIEQIHAKRAADAVHARQLVEALRGEPDKADRLSSGSLGSLFRRFVESCRQAMDCEELAILSLAGRQLSKATRSMLTDSLRMRTQARHFGSA